MVIGRLIPWRSIVVAQSAMLGPLAVTSVVHAQGGATVHIQVANGSHAGMFDVRTTQPCEVSPDTTHGGADAWQLTFDQDTSDPSGFTLRTGYGEDLLSIVWSNGDYTSKVFELEPAPARFAHAYPRGVSEHGDHRRSRATSRREPVDGVPERPEVGPVNVASVTRIRLPNGAG